MQERRVKDIMSIKDNMISNIKYDDITKAMYITVRKGKVERTVEIAEDIFVDYDRKGNALGVEMLNVKYLL